MVFFNQLIMLPTHWSLLYGNLNLYLVVEEDYHFKYLDSPPQKQKVTYYLEKGKWIKTEAGFCNRNLIKISTHGLFKKEKNL